MAAKKDDKAKSKKDDDAKKAKEKAAKEAADKAKKDADAKKEAPPTKIEAKPKDGGKKPDAKKDDKPKADAKGGKGKGDGIDWKPGQLIKRDASGAVIARRTAEEAGVGGGGSAGGKGKQSPLKQFAAVVAGLKKPGSVSVEAQKALGKLDVSGIKYDDLAKFGLDDDLTKKQFKEFKGLFKDAQAEGTSKVDKVNKKEIKELAKFAQGTARDNTIADLDKGIDKIVPPITGVAKPGQAGGVQETPLGPAGIVAPGAQPDSVGNAGAPAGVRGGLANLDMSIFARRAVTRAQGIRAALKTSMRGDPGYGKSLARISLGAV